MKASLTIIIIAITTISILFLIFVSVLCVYILFSWRVGGRFRFLVAFAGSVRCVVTSTSTQTPSF